MVTVTVLKLNLRLYLNKNQLCPFEGLPAKQTFFYVHPVLFRFLNCNLYSLTTAMKLLSYLLLCLSLSSCANRFYSAGPIHIPAMKNAGDVNAGAGFHFTNSGSGLQFQTSVAASPYLGFMVNGHYNSVTVNWNSDGIDEKDQSRALYAEGAVGFMLPSSQNSFEVYAGVGTGTVKNRFAASLSDIGLMRYFIQPSFSMMNSSQTSAISVAVRFSYLTTSIRDTLFNSSNYYQEEMMDLNSARNAFFFEPAFQWKMGNKHQYKLNFSVSAPLTSIAWRYDRLNLGFGYNFLYRKQEAPGNIP